jgi:pimeloyl-ACP methyl ester carboxylesterase
VGLGLLDTNSRADLPERAAVRPRQQAEVRAGALEQIVTDELKPHYLAEANRGDPRLLALIKQMALDLGPEVFVQQSEALRTRADHSDVPAGLDVPLFLACGEEDKLCPPAWHEQMAAQAHASELHVIPGAGHMLPLERPDALGPLLANWLNRIEKDIKWPIAS